MAGKFNSIYLLHDPISLPIVVSDWDAITWNRRRSSEAAAGHLVSREDTGSFITSTAPSSKSPRPRWSTGFADYVDELWKNMSEGMKRKLREACVEILRRTDEAKDDHIFQHFDDDARLLD